MSDEKKSGLGKSDAQKMLAWALTEQLDAGGHDERDDTELELPGFDLLGILGRGGMGTVYRAMHHDLERVVALKVFTAKGGDQELFVQRLKREGRLMAKLEHPNVLGIFDALVLEDGTPYLVLEYVDGEDLQKRLLERKKLKVKEAIRIAVKVCNGLSAVHSLGVIHRDIKPANVLLGVDGSVKVTDFGVSKEATKDQNTALTMTGTTIGTVDYMSPEQARGETLDERSDIYSVGVLLYEMISGVTPRGAFEPLTKYGASKELEKLVMRCLQRDALKRPASAENLAIQLKKVYKNLSARRRRDKSASWYAAAAGLAAVGVLGMFLAREMRGSNQQSLLTETPSEIPADAPTPEKNVWIDLTKDLDVKSNTLSGQWWKHGSSLVCANEKLSQLQFNSRPEGEYVLVSHFTRVSGKGAVVLRVPSSLGLLSVIFDSRGVSIAELQHSGSRKLSLRNSKDMKVKLELTDERLACFSNDKLVTAWDLKNLERQPYAKWQGADADSLAVAVDGAQVIFRSMRVMMK